jgi:predicted flavoprotein YhiN
VCLTSGAVPASDGDARPRRYRGWSGWSGDGNFYRPRVLNVRIVCLDSARRIGAKILVSGGSRCNVTNRVVTERDFWGGSTRFVRNVLRAFPETRAAEFFSELGVTLHEEEDGKLFPDSNTSRTVAERLAARNRTSGDHGG